MMAPYSSLNLQNSAIREWKVPCWPGASSYTVFFTRTLNRIIVHYFFLRAFFVFAAMFVFEQQTEDALRLVGYDATFISSFPFIRNQYLIASERLNEINIAHFHLLDVAVWWLIILVGMRFLATTIFLKQYDDRYRYVRQILSRGYERYGWVVYFGVVMMVAPFIVSNMQLVLSAPEFFLFVKYFPRTYFFMILFIYYLSLIHI